MAAFSLVHQSPRAASDFLLPPERLRVLHAAKEALLGRVTVASRHRAWLRERTETIPL